ncbi:MAG: alanine--tRNA ligase [Candidatus Liptonbacteria bacterium]|nr:alanine--tRNA ligase [Candidatus Liptonbacteria bacterium]
MTSGEIRQKYLDFFKVRGHAIIPSASLVPENDPSTLFTGSGMQPMVPYLLGANHPEGVRIADSQKSFRTVDIDEVGDNRHTTFFEMLGNWSLGDYFKKEQLPWVFEFLTKEIGLDPKRLYVTAFFGDEKNKLPRDTESAEIWKQLFKEKNINAEIVLIGSEADGYARGMKEGERIFYYDAKKNWWSRAGVPENMPAGEPGGPDSEIFYDFGSSTSSTGSPQASSGQVRHDPKFGARCHPNCDCGRFLEIGNSVFMEYMKKPDGSFAPLPKQNVDFGGGLERIAMAAANVPDIIAVCHRSILDALEKMSGKKYDAASPEAPAFRVVADHIKAASFLIGDGVAPSNTERGYFVRRLLRRAIRYADQLGMKEAGLAALVHPALQPYAQAYPETYAARESIEREVAKEEEKFRKTLKDGLREFEKISQGRVVTGKDAFVLFSTYGFPYEVTLELAKERGVAVNEEEFKAEMKKHQDLSRTASAGTFKGGLADSSEKTTRLHTAHHLLLRALQMVLGPGVKQRGSNITQERLRMDFSYEGKMTEEQRQEAERIVNEKIAEDLPVTRSEMALEDAEKLHAEHEFGAKYPARVSVYSVGPKSATLENPQFDKAFSIEFCGGPHVTHTGAIGKFVIKKEEAVAAGIRRIRGMVG